MLSKQSFISRFHFSFVYFWNTKQMQHTYNQNKTKPKETLTKQTLTNPNKIKENKTKHNCMFSYLSVNVYNPIAFCVYCLFCFQWRNDFDWEMERLQRFCVVLCCVVLCCVVLCCVVLFFCFWHSFQLPNAETQKKK